VNTGTIPSKALRETALYFSGLRQRGLYGVDYQIKRDISIADFMFRERAVVEAQWQLIDDNLKRHGVDQIQGAARFVAPNAVEVTRYGREPRVIEGSTLLIASGSQPQQPTDIAVDGTTIFDSDSLLTMGRIPASMLVLGGGVIACEYACTFAALGVRVTIVNARPRLLAHLDQEIGEALRQQMASRLGITIYSDVVASEIAADGERAVVRLGESGTTLSADCMLFSAGRVGASSGLGLREIGVETNARGFIQVDANYRTAVPGIYAAGDIVGYPALASTAMEQARVAICHAFELRYKQEMATVVPYGVWTIPEIATVGPTEDELRARRVEYEVGRAQFRANPRGLILGEVDGFLKLVFSPHDRRLLAASIVGEGACELIHVAAACLGTGGGIDTFIQNVYNYPALSDAYKYAAYDGLQALAKRHASRGGLPSGSYRAVES
jgi:NAD(P) transhydrogenase